MERGPGGCIRTLDGQSTRREAMGEAYLPSPIRAQELRRSRGGGGREAGTKRLRFVKQALIRGREVSSTGGQPYTLDIIGTANRRMSVRALGGRSGRRSGDPKASQVVWPSVLGRDRVTGRRDVELDLRAGTPLQAGDQGASGAESVVQNQTLSNTRHPFAAFQNHACRDMVPGEERPSSRCARLGQS